MPGRTKTLRIKPKPYGVSKKEKPMSVDDAFELAFPKTPHYAVCLKGLRAREGLTQVQFAEKLGIKQSYLSDIERGKRTIGKEMAKRIANLFNIDYRILL